MASTNFKLFDENKTNMMSDTEYNINTQRLNGVQAGIASSQLQNKTLHQTSLVAYSLTQIMIQNGYDANDSAAVSAFVGNMSNSLLQKVLDKATSAEAQTGTVTNKWISPATMKAAALLLSGGTMSGAIDMGNNKITNLADPTDSLDSANKKYVDEKVGTWNTLFEKEEVWSDSGPSYSHQKTLYSPGELDMLPLSGSKECKISLKLFGSLTVINSASYSQAIDIGYGGFPSGNVFELAYFTAGTSQMNVDGFELISIFNDKSYCLVSTGGSSSSPRISLYNKENSRPAIGCTEQYKNASEIYFIFGKRGIQPFSFSNLHYKLKMEYKN